MLVSLIGLGCAECQLTTEALQVITEAQLIIGAKRMLATLSRLNAELRTAYLSGEILQILKETTAERVCIVCSGDTGFYSGAATYLPLLQQAGIPVRVYPGISSLQTLAARVGSPWQTWNLCSAHGTDCDPLKEIMCGKPCFFLTGGKHTPQTICRQLCSAGLNDLQVWIGENLGYPSERLLCGTAAEFSAQEAAQLSVLLTAAVPVYPACAPGIPDEEFLREKVPMTKREVRASILSLLRISPADICWDIGAGTGSVSIELALHSAGVWAMERKPEAIELIRRNREKFCAWNLRIAEGEAPDGLKAFPVPDAVFVGGSGGKLNEILEHVHQRNPKAQICISAIALETLSSAAACLQELGYTVSVTQIAVSRTRPVGGLHMLTAQNPVFLILGEQP